MNLKQAKMLRRAMKNEGIDPKEVSYSEGLPYLSAPLVVDPLTGRIVLGKTLKPLRLSKCGRLTYKGIKKAFMASKGSTK